MKEGIIVRRYAEAFVGYSKMTNSVPVIVDEMRKVKALLRDIPDLKTFFFNKEITFQEKAKFIDTFLSKLFIVETLSFLKFLIEKWRIEHIVEIADYVRVKYAHGEAVDAVLSTTSLLDLETIQQIKDSLERKLHKKLNLYIRIDPDLNGGVKVKIGNFVLDGSVKKQFIDIKKKLMTVRVG